MDTPLTSGDLLNLAFALLGVVLSITLGFVLVQVGFAVKEARVVVKKADDAIETVRELVEAPLAIVHQVQGVVRGLVGRFMPSSRSGTNVVDDDEDENNVTR